MAPYGHTFAQVEHPLQRSSSDLAVHGFVISLSFARSPMAFTAAAPAWETVSGMSLGPWHTPDRKIPAVGDSTGRSLGCASVRKLLVSMLAVSMVAIFLTEGSGSMAVARTTISASMRICLLSMRSTPCTNNCPFGWGATLPTWPLM